MRKNTCYLLLCLLLQAGLASAQMWNGQDTLYGLEWIAPGQSYYRIPVVEEGLHRISYAQLQSAGLPAASLGGGQYQLWCRGEEAPLFVSSADAPLPTDGYLEFWGAPNRGELDAYLYEDPAARLNPEYSLVTDTAYYFLTWVEPGTPTARIAAADHAGQTGLAPEPWYWAEAWHLPQGTLSKQSVRYYYGSNSSIELTYSRYLCDGFTEGFKKDQTVVFDPGEVYAPGPDAALDFPFLSNAAAAVHQFELLANGQLVWADTIAGSKFFRYTGAFPAAALSSGLSLQLEGTNGNNDRYAVGAAVLRYPRRFVLNGLSWERLSLPNAPGPRLVEAEGAGSAPVVMYDLSRRERLLSVPTDGLQRWHLGSAAGERELRIDFSPAVAAALEPVAIPQLDDALEADFLIISHERLRGGSTDWVQAYADYRSSAAGGGYSVAVLDVGGLYDIFGYGVQRHPQAIRNAVNYLLKEGQGLAYLFLVGKAQEYPAVRSGNNLTDAIAEGRMLVPSFGFPASDNLLVSRAGRRVAAVPVGRLPATVPDEVRVYLEKVQALEAQGSSPQTLAGRGWMKRFIHLGGGSSVSERQSIRNALASMQNRVELNRIGAQVAAFSKLTDEPLEASLTDQIFENINDGAAVLTFFGHSSPGTFDFNIDDPASYQNVGKTPLMLSLGCYSGNIFTSGKSIGERFVFLEGRGAIAFAASRGLGFISSLTGLGNSIYTHAGGSLYDKGLGDWILQGLTDYEGTSFAPTATMVEQFSLQGDPAIRLHPAPGPDLVFDPASVQADRRVITAQEASFELSFDIVNIGENLRDSISLSIVHRLPDGEERPLPIARAWHEGFRQAYRFALPVTGPEMVGENRYDLRLDTDEEIAEQPPAAEGNNLLPDFRVVVTDNTARAVWPPEFAVVNSTPVALSASTTDALAAERAYLFQIDTAYTFDSPWRREQRITQRGGLLQWSPSLQWSDSTVYYWRVSPDSVDTGLGYTWSSRSFTFIEGGEEGWRQGAFGQMIDGNSFDRVRVDSSNLALEFSEDFISLRIKNKVFNISAGDDRPNGFINGSRWSDFFRWEAQESINITVFDTEGRIVWNPKPGQYGSLNNTASKEIANFAFRVQTPAERDSIIYFLTDIVQPGYTVFLYPAIRQLGQNLNVVEWAADSITRGDGINLFNLIEAEGGADFRSLQSEMRPYLIVFKKGGGVIFEEVSDTPTGEVDYTYGVPGNWFEGKMRSVVIGPSKQWGSFSWSVSLEEPSDTAGISLYLIDTLSNTELFLESIDSFNFDLSGINADVYPYLQLEYDAFDINTTMPQLDYWSCNFEGRSEAALFAEGNYSFYQDTLQQGDTLKALISGAIFPMRQDSVLFDYQVYGPEGQVLVNGSEVVVSDQSGYFEWAFQQSTVNLLGTNELRIELRPIDFSDINRLNNTVSWFFDVIKDPLNPVLNVTFDGRRIQNGELVSPQPLIQIDLQDENKFLLLNDTNVISLELVFPDGKRTTVSMSDPRVEFAPAGSSSENVARIFFRPEFVASGVYKLIISGTDVTGNEAGRQALEVSFEVILETSVSNVLPYPNPFSTSTQFVYTLTGQALPKEFRVQIYTVSGRLVRDVPLHEVEVLQFGTHRTEFAWDGTDEYGDQLANGVYLYRVKVTDWDGKSYEGFEQSIDKFFRQGFGKIVLLR
ncbi:putative type IX secretion system sortase PorU2 [Phaeodactylibacter luteus]|nr:C25 family cysteine peptidase [Phaeodactylibacter luteus]